MIDEVVVDLSWNTEGLRFFIYMRLVQTFRLETYLVLTFKNKTIMVKQLQFKLMLLLCALVVGSGSVWADTSTVTASQVTSSSVTWTGSGSEEWSVSVDGGALGQNVTSGYAQIGTRSNPSNSVTFSTSEISGTITSIIVDCASYSGLGTISATVGGNAFGTQLQSVPSWSSSSGGDVTFSGNASGQIVITMTNGSGGRAMYVKSITVTYTPSGSGSSVAAPTFSPTAGEVAKGSTVTLEQPDATYIIYTTDGSDPSWDPMNGTEYESPIVINRVTTIKAIAVDADDNVSDIATATYTLIKVEPELSFTTANYEVSIDDVSSFVSQTINNPHNITGITYSVTPASVASIDASTGVVTLTGAKGKATVAATFDGNDEYLPSTVRYTINVYNPNEALFDFASKTDDYGSGVETTTDGSTYITEEKVWTNGVITLTTNGKYRWWDNDGTLRFYSNNPASTIVVTAAAGYLLTDITITGGQQFISNDANYSSGKWEGVAKSLTLTYNSSSSVNVKTITVGYTNKVNATVTTAGWATYIPTDDAQFASGDAYVVTEANVTAGTVTVAEVASVPANTPVLLKGAGTKTVTLLTDAPAAPATNLLSICNGLAPATGNYYWVLSDNDGTAQFMQWLNTAGTTDYSILNGRVVMILDKDASQAPSAARALRFVFDETTGISATVKDNGEKNHVVYNLNGQRVVKPTKGLYIVGGKKVLVK